GQDGYDPLFAFGHGLTYADKADLAALPEDPGIDANAASANTWFVRRAPATGLTLRLVGRGGAAMEGVHPAAKTADGSLEMTAINTEVQEGARRFAWTGEGVIQLLSYQPVDVSRETNGDVPVVLELRVDALPTKAKASVTASCGEGCSGEVAIGDALARLPRGEWTRLAVPLKCLRQAGADTGKLDVPFALRAAAGTTLALTGV